MKVLVLGGTGAMGTPLQQFLLEYGYDIHVTSRSKQEFGDIHYHYGNAHDLSFLSEVLKERFDVVVDFMSYTTDEFSGRVHSVLANTDQYIFLSSARVYAPCKTLITEDCPRLLDVCEDKGYLKTDEYALAKARQENALLNSGKGNWTIVRPSLTYNSERMQYAMGEKEDWLYRYLNHEKIVFAKNMGQTLTTMSWGKDVAKAISLLVGNDKAKGEPVHVAGAKAITWDEVNKIYWRVLTERFNRPPEIMYIDDWEAIGRTLGRYYQFKYARSVNRVFDNSKLYRLAGKIEFTDPEEGLTECLNDFMDHGMKFKYIPCKPEAAYNRLTKDKANLRSFSTKNKVKYLIGRYTFYLDWHF